MHETRVSLPELAVIAMTRAALGVGIGLLVAKRMSGSARKAVGWALVVSGALVTIPLAADVLHKARLSKEAGMRAQARAGAYP